MHHRKWRDQVFCHADIVGGLMNEGVAATRGRPPDAFPPLPTIVYSGHCHKPHTVAEPTARGRLIRYAGSPYQTSMVEAGHRKALLVLDREHGFTLLMHACGEGHIEVVQILLEINCDTDCINAINGRGNSALHLCASMGHSACVVALLQAGANPRLVGPDGKTAADFARALGHAQTAALLEDCRDSPDAGRGRRLFDAAGASAEGNIQSHLDIDGSDSDSDSADGLDGAAQGGRQARLLPAWPPVGLGAWSHVTMRMRCSM